MSFALYAIGFAIVIVGLTYGAHLLHIPIHWIVVLVMSCYWVWGSSKESRPTRQKDPPG